MSISIDQKILEIDKMIENHREKFVSKIILLNPIPDRKIGQNGLIFMHRLLRRSHALLEGGIEAIKKKNLLSLAAISRSHLETTGALFYFLDNLDRHYQNRVTYEDLDKKTVAFNWG